MGFSCAAMSVQAEHFAHFLGVIPSITIMPGLPRYDSSPCSSSPSQTFGDKSPSRTDSPDSVRSENSENPEDIGKSGDLSFVRPSEVQLIDRIETAQLEGRIPYSPNDSKGSQNLDSGNGECCFVKLFLSKHGLKEILDRLPLHTIAQAVSYDDGLGHWNVAVKVCQVGKNMYSCYLFQTRTEEEAVKVSQSLQDVFQKVTVSNQ